MKWNDLLGLALIVVSLVSWFTGGTPWEPSEPPGPRLVYLLEQDADRKQHPEFVRLIGNPALRSTLEERGHTYRLIDKDNAGELYGHLFANGEPLPRLVIATNDRTLYSGPVPTPLEAFLTELEAHGG